MGGQPANLQTGKKVDNQLTLQDIYIYIHGNTLSNGNVWFFSVLWSDKSYEGRVGRERERERDRERERERERGQEYLYIFTTKIDPAPPHSV